MVTHEWSLVCTFRHDPNLHKRAEIRVYALKPRRRSGGDEIKRRLLRKCHSVQQIKLKKEIMEITAAMSKLIGTKAAVKFYAFGEIYPIYAVSLRFWGGNENSSVIVANSPFTRPHSHPLAARLARRCA